jgi:hypothetical protein
MGINSAFKGLMDYPTYLHRSTRREYLACRGIGLPPQKDRVLIFEDVTRRDMTFTYMTENFFVLRSLNFEETHLQEINEEGAEPIGWKCCESDTPIEV